MRELDEKQRATVEAYFFRGLSLGEIAEELNDSFGNVRHHLYRGIAKMRKLVVVGKQAEPLGKNDRDGSPALQRNMAGNRQSPSVGGAD